MQETRDRIAAAVAQVGYIPDELASWMATGSSRLICCLVSTLEAPYFVTVLRGIADTAELDGLSITVSQTNYSAERAQDLLRAMLGARPRGIVLMGVEVTPPMRQMLTDAEIPVVQAWEIVAEPVGICIGFSHEEASRALTERVIRAGRRNLVFAARSAEEPRAAARIAGFQRTLREHGLEGAVIAKAAASAFQVGTVCATEILASHPTADAIVCAADTIAAGLVAELQRNGRRVPADVAVTGFGDLDFAAVLEPRLTTVKFPDRTMGVLAAQFILAPDWRECQSARPIIDVGFDVIERHSAPLDHQ